ncbi:hypothetical protein M5K25_003109 [Dendrobium thyrsiflorum]|uniref:Uncharacterized protein n=1 Tax=Dendrobium thyrsiflorum TaxID=117978 RepID=A0ABD0VX23_DENTH
MMARAPFILLSLLLLLIIFPYGESASANSTKVGTLNIPITCQSNNDCTNTCASTCPVVCNLSCLQWFCYQGHCVCNCTASSPPIPSSFRV